ncbi:MAG: NAD(P)H-dependent oxidoreductase [Propionibacteriales bacterium]|nr:NAD(P)H-dependent oxidoreductase [Propionibacteriales bacterium]
MKIGIIIGSTRPGRKGEQVAQWARELAGQRSDASYELVDLAEFDLHLLNDPTIPAAAKGQYADEATRRWGATIDALDGFVFVTPEYNHGVPGALKNAFDVISPEWANKAVGFVSYGADGGVRAVEQWRGIVINAHLYAVRGQVAIYLFEEFDGEGRFTPKERRAGEFASLLDQLVPLAGALEPLR